MKVWKTKFVDKLGPDLESSDINPEGYSGERIQIIGFCTLVFRFKERECVAKLYISKQGPSVLGWFEQGKLNIILNPNSPNPVMVISEYDKCGKSMLDKFTEVFREGIGRLINFKHKLF